MNELCLGRAPRRAGRQPDHALEGARERRLGAVAEPVEDPRCGCSGLASQDVPLAVRNELTEVHGRNAHPTDGVQRALGREPRDFADYARDAAASGVCSRDPVRA